MVEGNVKPRKHHEILFFGINRWDPVQWESMNLLLLLPRCSSHIKDDAQFALKIWSQKHFSTGFVPGPDIVILSSEITFTDFTELLRSISYCFIVLKWLTFLLMSPFFYYIYWAIWAHCGFSFTWTCSGFLNNMHHLKHFQFKRHVKLGCVSQSDLLSS